MSESELHSSIIALVSLASGVASKHPDMGLCQVNRLRGMGISESQIASVVEIARHIRAEAAEKIDHVFDQQMASQEENIEESRLLLSGQPACGCTPTPSGQAWC